MLSLTTGHFVLVDVPTNICFWTDDGSAACGLKSEAAGVDFILSLPFLGESMTQNATTC